MKYLLWIIITFSFSLEGLTQNTQYQESTSFLLGPTASLSTKEGVTLRSVDVAYNSLEWSASDEVLLGAGFIYFPELIDPIGTFNLQWSFGLSDRLTLGISSNWFIPLNSDNGYEFVAPQFLLASYKMKNTFIHGGIGTAVSEDDMSILGQIGVVTRIGKRFSFINENYWGYDPTNNFYEDNFFIIGFGGRMHFSWWYIDLGIMNAVLIGGDGNAYSPFPHLGIAFRI